jgi:hypothetical protein
MVSQKKPPLPHAAGWRGNPLLRRTYERAKPLISFAPCPAKRGIGARLAPTTETIVPLTFSEILLMIREFYFD